MNIQMRKSFLIASGITISISAAMMAWALIGIFVAPRNQPGAFDSFLLPSSGLAFVALLLLIGAKKSQSITDSGS